MKRLWIICMVTCLSTLGLLAGEPARSILLLSDFKLQQEGDTVTYAVQLPGTIQNSLMELGVIPHHFVGQNEELVQWVSDCNWLYMTSFELSQEELEGAQAYWLNLGLVDTYAEIYLNGALVGRADNLFKEYRIGVKEYLRAGENRLVIRLLSTTQLAHAHYLSNGFNYPADNDRNDIKYSAFVRKSPYHFGWDWGPRLISMGVGAPIELERVVGPTNGDLYISTEITWGAGREATSATVMVQSSINALGQAYHQSLYLLDSEGNTLPLIPELQDMNKESATYTFEVAEPKLWQPNGWGEQAMYALVRRVFTDHTFDVDTTYFGIREVELIQERDEIGESFYFMVNQRPLYAKGANYLPHDRRFGGGGRTLEQIFREDLVPAHFNMIRVWGGGAYETEEFYDLADKYGILVWQDFPFACSTYPNDPAFRASVIEEAEDQLTRLRNHPSLALLCGNNEVREGLRHWGWKKKYGYSDEVWAQMFADYDSFFGELLPELVRRFSPHVQYIHGSPLNSNWGHPESFLSGDSHNWRVWFGGKDFDEFEKSPGRFSSEFGFQSFPEMKTIQSFAPGGDLDTLTIESPILKNRQRSFIGNQRITDYMEREYPVPTLFSDYVYVGQVLHGRGMEYALRSIRHSYPLNMGALYWQFNDVWPTVSWSSIDYWGNYKSLHYRVIEAYAPYIVDVIEEGGELVAKYVIDNINHQGTLQMEAVEMSYNGEVRSSYRMRLSEPNEFPTIGSVALFDNLKLADDSFILIKLLGEEGELARQVYYPVKPKDMPLSVEAPEMVIHAERGKLVLTLKSETLIKDLFIGTPWQGARYSDNYFDLLPGEAKTVTITHPDITEQIGRESLTFQSMNMILDKYSSHD